MRPDGHRGEGPGRKKLDPCSNSSRTLRTGEAGPAEGINTQTEPGQGGATYLSQAVYTVCASVWWILCVWACVCVLVCERGERGEGVKKRQRGRVRHLSWVSITCNFSSTV